MDLVPQGPGFDVHALLHIGHTVDHKGVGPGHVDHDGRVDLPPVGQGDTLYFSIVAAYLHHLAVVEELAAVIFGRSLHVVAGQLGIVNVAGLRSEDGPCQFLIGVFPKRAVFVRQGRRVVGLG